jgi:peptidyl-prolyl cis-trans isomerase D
MAKEKPTKIVTKKHLARLERERRQIRLITAISIALVVIIVGGIGYGILNQTVLQELRPAVTVNGQSVSIREFRTRVKAARQQEIDQYMQYYQFANMLGMDPTDTTSSIGQTLSQIQSNLDSPTAIGNQVLLDITNDLLIRQYASAHGITVTTDDVDKAIQDALGYYPDGTPTPTLTPTQLTYATLDATQYALVSPTPIPSPMPSSTPAPSQTPDRSATATPVPTATLVPTETPIPSITPTATPYTYSEYQTQYKDAVAYYGKLGMSEALFRKVYFESPIYRKRVSDIVTADVTHEQEQVWARHILVADESTANTLYAQLVGGADFATLASKYSIDTTTKNSGGDLGWFGRGTMLAEFENAAFSLQIGEISQPVQTTAGWHIIQVLGHEVRPLTDTEYQTAVTNAMNSWLTDERNSADIVTSTSAMNNLPTSPNLTEAFNSLYMTATAYYANLPTTAPTATP